MIKSVFIIVVLSVSAWVQAGPTEGFELCKATHQERYKDAQDLIAKGANKYGKFNAFCTYDILGVEETLYQYVSKHGSLKMQDVFGIKKYENGTVIDVISYFNINSIMDISSSKDEGAKYLLEAVKRQGEFYDTTLFILLDFSPEDDVVELTQNQIDFINLIISNGAPLDSASYSIETYLSGDNRRTCYNTDSKEEFDCIELVKP